MDEDIWDMEQAKVVVRKSLTELLLIIAMLLLIMDIAIRRLSVDVAGKLKSVVETISSKIYKLTGTIKNNKTKHLEEIEKDNNLKNKAENKETETNKELTNKKPETTKGKEKTKEKQNSDTLDMNVLLQKKKDRE